MQTNNTQRWAEMGIYIVQASINKRPSRVKGNLSPYEAFYGKRLKNSPLEIISEDLLRLCKTEDGLLAACDLVSNGAKVSDEEIKRAIEEGDSRYDELQIAPNTLQTDNTKRVIDELSSQVQPKKVQRTTDNNGGLRKAVIPHQQVPFDIAKVPSTTVSRNSNRNTRSGAAASDITKVLKNLMTSRQSYKFAYPSLKCSCCFSGSHLLSIGDAAYVADCRNTKRWYDTDFISTFATLVAHHAHKTSSSESKIQLVHCSWPKSIPSSSECRDLPQTVETMVSVLLGCGHFCVLEFDLATRTIEVLDGLRFPLSTWKDHMVNILRRTNLIGRDEDLFLTTCNEELSQLHGAGGYSMDIDWTIKQGKFLPQLDSYNCGPIACLKIMHCFGKFDLDEPITAPSYRDFVMNYYENLLRQCEGDLRSISLLPINRNVDNMEIDQEPCGICQSVAPGHPMTTMTCCKQQLHALCAAEWLTTHQSCIYCRQEVTEISVDGAIIPFGTSSVVTMFESKVKQHLDLVSTPPSSSSRKSKNNTESTVTFKLNVHKSDIETDTAQMRATMFEAQKHSAILVNKRRSKTAYSQQLKVGDICNVRVEGNVRAATDSKNVPVMIISIMTSPTGKSVKYSVASRDGHLKETFPRDRLEHCPNLDEKLMEINVSKEGFKSGLEVHEASALYNVSGGGGSCGCEKLDCSKNNKCKCNKRGRYCTTKCHKGRGKNPNCKLCPPSPPPVDGNVCHPVTKK